MLTHWVTDVFSIHWWILTGHVSFNWPVTLNRSAGMHFYKIPAHFKRGGNLHNLVQSSSDESECFDESPPNMWVTHMHPVFILEGFATTVDLMSQCSVTYHKTEFWDRFVHQPFLLYQMFSASARLVAQSFPNVMATSALTWSGWSHEVAAASCQHHSTHGEYWMLRWRVFPPHHGCCCSTR